MAQLNPTTLEKLLANFESAAVELSWIGSYPPEDHGEIERRYAHNKRKLIEFIKSSSAD